MPPADVPRFHEFDSSSAALHRCRGHWRLITVGMAPGVADGCPGGGGCVVRCPMGVSITSGVCRGLVAAGERILAAGEVAVEVLADGAECECRCPSWVALRLTVAAAADTVAVEWTAARRYRPPCNWPGAPPAVPAPRSRSFFSPSCSAPFSRPMVCPARRSACQGRQPSITSRTWRASLPLSMVLAARMSSTIRHSRWSLRSASPALRPLFHVSHLGQPVQRVKEVAGGITAHHAR